MTASPPREEPPYIARDPSVEFVSGGRQRLAAARQALLNEGADPALLDRLVEAITLEMPSPYRIFAVCPGRLLGRRSHRKCSSSAWCHAPRSARSALGIFFARPVGGGKKACPPWAASRRTIHCDVCQIDFTAHFERSVELTFRPNPPSARSRKGYFCVGGPQDSPHVVAQQLIPAGETRTISPTLEPGHYRVRTLRKSGSQSLFVEPEPAL